MVEGQTTLFFYGLDGELLAEVDAATGETQREYVWLDGTPLAYVTAGAIYHIHVDHLGTPQVLTDSRMRRLLVTRASRAYSGSFELLFRKEEPGWDQSY